MSTTILSVNGASVVNRSSGLAANPKLAEYLAHQQSLHKGTLSMTDLLSFLARDPSLSLAFNYASLLLNTSFFLEGLVKDTSVVQDVPGKFAGLEDQLVAQARGMVGSGWLWVSLRFFATASYTIVLMTPGRRSSRIGIGLPRYQPTAPAPSSSVIECNKAETPLRLSTTPHPPPPPPTPHQHPQPHSANRLDRKRKTTTSLMPGIQITSLSSRSR